MPNFEATTAEEMRAEIVKYLDKEVAQIRKSALFREGYSGSVHTVDILSQMRDVLLAAEITPKKPAPEFDINRARREYLDEHKQMPWRMPWLHCADGLVMSVQACLNRNCEPCPIDLFEYRSFEVGCVSEHVEALMPFEVDDGLYGFVPAKVINYIVKSHGGFSHWQRPEPRKGI